LSRRHVGRPAKPASAAPSWRTSSPRRRPLVRRP